MAMTWLFGKNAPAGVEGVEAALQRSMRAALFLSISIMALAGVYFGVLYLVAH
jgi:hypothetical protein